MTEKKTRGAGRSNNWATMLYDDSVVENWKDILNDLHVDCFVSPLHDQDLNPNGEKKKAHRHLLVNFPTVKTAEQAREVFAMLGGAGCERVASFRNYARYLCHLDNPDKARYLESDVITFGSHNYYDVIAVPNDKYEVIAEIIDFCEVNHIYSYARLLRITREYNPVWFRALCDNASWVVKEYLKSSLWESLNPSYCNDDQPLIDPKTGEIMDRERKVEE